MTVLASWFEPYEGSCPRCGYYPLTEHGDARRCPSCSVTVQPALVLLDVDTGVDVGTVGA